LLIGLIRATLSTMCRNILNPKARFLREVNSNLAWLERELALLRPENSDYASEKRALQSAMRELRELIRLVTSTDFATN